MPVDLHIKCTGEVSLAGKHPGSDSQPPPYRPCGEQRQPVDKRVTGRCAAPPVGTGFGIEDIQLVVGGGEVV